MAVMMGAHSAYRQSYHIFKMTNRGLGLSTSKRKMVTPALGSLFTVFHEYPRCTAAVGVRTHTDSFLALGGDGGPLMLSWPSNSSPAGAAHFSGDVFCAIGRSVDRLN